MDFGRFKQFAADQTSQRAENDPAFAFSEEAQAFLDHQRNEDLDSRAAAVREQTSADDRGEPSLSETADEAVSSPVATDGPDASPAEVTQQEEVITAPAEVFSDVALGDALQAPSSPPEGSSPGSPDAEPDSPVQEDSPPAEFSPAESEQPTVATSQEPVAEFGPEAEPQAAAAEHFESPPAEFQVAAERQPEPEVSPVIAEDAAQEPAASLQSPEPSPADAGEPAEVFQQDGESADPVPPSQEVPPPEFTAASNDQISEEGVRVDSLINERNESTWLVPETMDHFPDLLREFDKEFSGATYVPAGDDLGEIPEFRGLPESQELQSTSEVAESMLSAFSKDILMQERNRP